MTAPSQVADLIEQARATQALARAKDRHHIVRGAQDVIDDLTEKQATLDAAQLRVSDATQELAEVKSRLDAEDGQ